MKTPWMPPRFVIFIETISGEIIEAFTWCRDEASGIARAQKNAVEFGHGIPVRVWAEPIEINQ
jgi:hypothetical protein